MNYNLDVGVNLDNRTIYLSIPSGTSISEVKTICRTDKGNTIYENSTGGYYHTDDLENDVCFYDSNTNVDHIKLPDDFGTIIEIDNTSVLYEYIERVSHEKVYVTSEDYAKQESMSKDDIEAEIEEGVRSYGVPLNSVMGFDGTEEDIPDGFELTDETFGGGGGETLPIGSEIDYDGVTVPTGWEEITNPNIYSTNETKTNKIWIDGKPIYRKVTISNSISNFINTGISNYDDLTEMRVLVKQTNTGDWRNIPWLYSYNNTIGSGNWTGGFYFTEGQLRFQIGSELSNISKMIAIIEYTKTTD